MGYCRVMCLEVVRLAYFDWRITLTKKMKVSLENKVQFFNVLHELINWINDLEHGVASYWDYIRDIKGFFPECGCKKKE